MIPLGQVNLTHRIGKGGMGTVWVGVHRLERTAVAVKVLSGEFATDTAYRRAFRDEVRAVASLDHPHIVMVHDHGRVTHAVAARSDGALEAGAPYLVMELVPHGTLAGRLGQMRWSEVQRVLLELLDALGHAHARGVLHRDLKPENVLLTGTGAVKLSDFGLSHAVEEVDADAPLNAGTPAYMAPEQFDCRWRDYGPWTDLYALGCVAWAMVQGSPPFGTGAEWSALRVAHQHRSPPPIRTSSVLPAGFDGWISQLLHKSPARRFRRAAEAAAALEELGRTSGGVVIPTLRSLDHSRVILPTIGEQITVRRPEAVDTLVLDEDELPPPEPLPELHLAGEIPTELTIPASWRSERPAVQRTLGTGLGLLGLRVPPMVGREEERDQLWGALRRVAGQQRPELVLLHGATGTGKSRLARWLGERAHELGVASIARATHRPVPGPGHGLRGLVCHILRCGGLTPFGAGARIRRLVGEDTPALAELLHPAPGGPRPRSQSERYAPIARLLERMAHERTVIVWLDDVQWGLDALRFARWLLAMWDGPLRVLVVATLVDEQAAEFPDVTAALTQLHERSDVTRVEVGPLPREHRGSMIRALLGMSGTLAAKIDARTNGNPLFVVQLVESLVQRGLLVPGARGLHLREGAEIDLPRDVAAVWSQRVERVLARTGFGEALGIEIAAVLGQDVDADEWQEACEHASAIAGGPAFDALLDQRLVRPAASGLQTGWHFVHGVLCEVLHERAEKAGRLQGHHAACAQVMSARRQGTAWPPGVAERAGRHLLASGDPVGAIDPLLTGAAERMELGDYDTAQALLATRDEALATSGADASDPRWASGWLLAAQTARLSGDYASIEARLDQVDAGVEEHGWAVEGVRSLCLRGELHRIRGSLHAAIRALRGAEARSMGLHDPQILASVRFHLGEALSSAGDHGEAYRLLHQSITDFEAAGDAQGAARALQGLAELAKERGDHDEALRLFASARDRHRHNSDPWGLASALNSSGDVLRYQGRLDEALAAYRESARLFRRIGSDSVVFPEYNAALAHLERGDVAASGELLTHALRGFEHLGGRAAAGDCHLALAACAAGELRWEDFDQHVKVAAEIVEETAIIDVDTARVAELAGTLAFNGGQRRRAGDAWLIALAQRRAMHHEDHIAELERQLALCEPE